MRQYRLVLRKDRSFKGCFKASDQWRRVRLKRHTSHHLEIDTVPLDSLAHTVYNAGCDTWPFMHMVLQLAAPLYAA